MKCILTRDTNLNGHNVKAYCCKNLNGKFSFVLFAESAAMRFKRSSDAYEQRNIFNKEKGYALENMHVEETSTDQSFEVVS